VVSLNSARRIGIDAAIMVMAPSAAARMTNCVVDSVNVDLEMEGSCVILMMDVTPALSRLVQYEEGSNGSRDKTAYNTPRLIAMRTPNFSFLFIVRFQMIFHGIMARTISMAPE